jgi:DNA-binding NarL/FixJ family response regulator
MMVDILIADDHKIVREGLGALVENQPDMKVVGLAKNGREAVELAVKLTPDVIVMDITMADLNGIEATRLIHKKHPDIKIIALSMHSDRRYVSGMLDAGAFGYLLKDCAFEELINAINDVLKNRFFLSHEITDVVVKDYLIKTSKKSLSDYSTLTDREREVLQLLAEGKSTKQAAEILFVSVKTIEGHRSQIMRKLNVHNIAGLTKLAIKEGLTSLEI